MRTPSTADRPALSADRRLRTFGTLLDPGTRANGDLSPWFGSTPTDRGLPELPALARPRALLSPTSEASRVPRASPRAPALPAPAGAAGAPATRTALLSETGPLPPAAGPPETVFLSTPSSRRPRPGPQPSPTRGSPVRGRRRPRRPGP